MRVVADGKTIKLEAPESVQSYYEFYSFEYMSVQQFLNLNQKQQEAIIDEMAPYHASRLGGALRAIKVMNEISIEYMLKLASKLTLLDIVRSS